MFSFRKIAAIVVGSLFIAVGINCFLVPLGILDGGIIGISLIINYLFHIKIGLIMLISSIPIFAVAWFYNRDMLYNSINGLLFSSYMIDLLEPAQYYFIYYVEWTPFTRAVLGGFAIGMGIGVMIRYECSTGGTDLLAHFIAKYVPINIGVLILVMDIVIVGTGELLLPGNKFVLSLLTITAGGIATGLCTLNLQKQH